MFANLQSQNLRGSGSKLALEVAYRVVKEQDLNDADLTEETLTLYLRFFQGLDHDRLKTALQILNGSNAKELVSKSLGLQFLLRECWLALNDKDSLIQDCKSRIKEGDRNWAIISQLAESSVLGAVGAVPEHNFKAILESAQHDKWLDRGSFLGVLEVFRLAKQYGLQVPGDLKYSDLVLQYWTTFNNKFTCFEDLRPYLEDVKHDVQGSLICSEDPPPLSSEAAIIRRVNEEKATIFFQTSFADQDLSTCRRLMDEYCSSLQHVKLPDTEMQLGNDLALQAAYAALSSTPPNNIKVALAIAAYTCGESSQAYKSRILLIRLLLNQGCLKLALEQFRELGLKAVQLDTASHYCMDRNTSFGGNFADEISAEWNNSLKPFYDLSANEVPEVLARAFKNGKFSQVSDLCDFENCLQASSAKIIFELDMLRAGLVNNAEEAGGREAVIASLNAIKSIINGMLW